MIKIICLFLVLSPFLLSTWQCARLSSKLDLIATQKKEPLDFFSLNTKKHNFTKIYCTGIYKNDINFYLFAGQLGYNILTPIMIDGKYILVNRGTVKSKLSQNIENETVNLIGTLLTKFHKTPLVDNQEKENIWFYVDIDRMSEISGIKLEPYIIHITQDSNNSFITPNKDINITANHHIFYAIMWFILGIMSLLFYIKLMKN